MSKKEKVEETKVEEQQELPELGLQDLVAAKNIMQAAMDRGAFKAAEYKTVGTIYERFDALIVALSPKPEAVEETTEDKTTEDKDAA